MNGEKAAFQTPTFALKRQRTLDTLIRDIYAEHCSDHKVVGLLQHHFRSSRTLNNLYVPTHIFNLYF